MANFTDYLTVDEVAKKYGCTANDVGTFCQRKNNGLPFIKRANVRFILASDAEEFFNSDKRIKNNSLATNVSLIRSSEIEVLKSTVFSLQNRIDELEDEKKSFSGYKNFLESLATIEKNMQELMSNKSEVDAEKIKGIESRLKGCANFSKTASERLYNIEFAIRKITQRLDAIEEKGRPIVRLVKKESSNDKA